jgi:hypothetical protein
VLDKMLGDSGYEEVEAIPTPQYQYEKENVEGVVLACTPFADGTRIMQPSEGREILGLVEDIELARGDVTGDTPHPEDVAGAGGATDPKKKPALRLVPGKPPEPEQPEAGAEKALGQTRDGKLKRRAFVGEGSTEKRRLATRFEQMTARKLRQQEAAVMEMGRKMAAAAGKKIAE